MLRVITLELGEAEKEPSNENIGPPRRIATGWSPMDGTKSVPTFTTSLNVRCISPSLMSSTKESSCGGDESGITTATDRAESFATGLRKLPA